MHLFIPSIYANETLRSYLRRAAPTCKDGSSGARAMIKVFGRRTIHPTMPNDLIKINQLFNIDKFGENHLLHHHTLFDYFYAYAAFQLRARRLDQHLTRVSGARIPVRLAMDICCDDKVSPRCHACEEQSFKEMGAYCELRLHHLPYQRYCPIHAEAIFYRGPRTPTLIGVSHRGSCLEKKNCQKKFDRRSQELLLSSEVDLRSTLFRKLQIHGYISNSGHARSKVLFNNMLHFFSNGFEDERLTCVLKDPCYLNVFLRKLSNERKVPSPAMGTLVRWYLDECQEQRRDTMDGKERCRVRRLSVTEDDIASVRDSVRMAWAGKNVSYQSLLDKAIRENRPVVRRPKSFKLESQSVASRLLREGISRKDVATKCGISMATINRFCIRNGLCEELKDAARERRREKARAELSNVIANTDDDCRTTLQRLSAKTLTWLRRNDSGWLDSEMARCEKTKPKIKRISPERHSLIVQHRETAVARVADDERSCRERPSRLTTARLARESGLSQFLISRISDLAIHTETEEVWVKRRLRWVDDQFANDPATPVVSGWKRYRLAGIRKR